MDAYFNTPLKNLSAEDLKRIVTACNSEITKRENEHYDNLYESVIESLTDMVKYFPYRSGMTCSNCGEDYDWDDVLRMIKNCYEQGSPYSGRPASNMHKRSVVILCILYIDFYRKMW